MRGVKIFGGQNFVDSKKLGDKNIEVKIFAESTFFWWVNIWESKYLRGGQQKIASKVFGGSNLKGSKF